MIAADDITYSIGDFNLRASLEIRNEYFVLLGMTGSGKTLFLESLCGLRQVHDGRIMIDGVDATGIVPWERNIGYVPQDGALFPHMSVAKNIGFSLRVKHVAKHERGEEIVRIARILHIDHLLGRRIVGLSGGERQRVALARAAISRPSALILDEPVSALDEHTRETVCRELKSLQRTLGLSVIHVCHSFEEAQLVGDRVGIMHNGRIVQVGTVDNLLNAPRNRYVARILRHENLFTGTATVADDDSESGRAGGASLIRTGNCVLRAPAGIHGDVGFLIRPWFVQPASLHRPDTSVNKLRGFIAEILSTGAYEKLRFEGDIPVVFYMSRLEVERSGLKPGSDVEIEFPDRAIHVLQERR